MSKKNDSFPRVRRLAELGKREREFLKIKSLISKSQNLDLADYAENLSRYRKAYFQNQKFTKYEEKIIEIIEKFKKENLTKEKKDRRYLLPREFEESKNYILSIEKDDIENLERIIKIIEEMKIGQK